MIHFDFVSSQPISRNPAWQVPTVQPKRLSSIITLAHMQSRWWRRRQNVLGATGAFVSGPNRRCSTTLEQSPRAVVEQGFEIWRARYLKNDFVCINQAQIKPRARPAGTQAEETDSPAAVSFSLRLAGARRRWWGTHTTRDAFATSSHVARSTICTSSNVRVPPDPRLSRTPVTTVPVLEPTAVSPQPRP